VLTSLVEFIVIAIPVLYCYIFMPLLRVFTKNGRYRLTVAAPSAPANSVWPLRHSSVIYSILLDLAGDRLNIHFEQLFNINILCRSLCLALDLKVIFGKTQLFF